MTGFSSDHLKLRITLIKGLTKVVFQLVYIANIQYFKRDVKKKITLKDNPAYIEVSYIIIKRSLSSFHVDRDNKRVRNVYLFISLKPNK